MPAPVSAAETSVSPAFAAVHCSFISDIVIVALVSRSYLLIKE